MIKLFVNSDIQKMSVLNDNVLIKQYQISTALKGLGCEIGSYQTPFGKHEINQMIGKGAERYAIFKARVPTGEIAKIETDKVSTNVDLITSRILWLKGLENTINSGYDQSGVCVDSFKRFIYIHGTNEEGMIGSPVSHGCIRMLNDDVIELFDLVELQTEVFIS